MYFLKIFFILFFFTKTYCLVNNPEICLDAHTWNLELFKRYKHLIKEKYWYTFALEDALKNEDLCKQSAIDAHLNMFKILLYPNYPILYQRWSLIIINKSFKSKYLYSAQHRDYDEETTICNQVSAYASRCLLLKPDLESEFKLAQKCYFEAIDRFNLCIIERINQNRDARLFLYEQMQSPNPVLPESALESPMDTTI